MLVKTRQPISKIESELKKANSMVSDDIKNSYIDINDSGVFGLFTKKNIKAGTIICEVPEELLNTKFSYINISDNYNLALKGSPAMVEAICDIEEHDELLIDQK
jgi:hypothetical protein